MEAWLKTPVPVKNDENPFEGYKVLHLIDDAARAIPVKFETILAFFQAFKLPSVGSEQPIVYQNACGMFTQDDGSFGMSVYFPPQTNFLYFPSNRKDGGWFL